MGHPATVAIMGSGACTSLGNAERAAAAMRASIDRGQEMPDWPYNDDTTNTEALVVGHPISGITDGFEGLGRLVRIGAAALADLRPLLEERGLSSRRSGLFVALESLNADAGHGLDDDGEAPSPTFESWAARFAERCCEHSGIPMAPEQRSYFEGRYGFARALVAAIDALRTHRLDHCLVGACDSELDPDRIDTGLSSGRIKTTDNPVGYAPGEAAVFLLIERAAASPRGRKPESLLLPPSLAERAGTTAGAALARAMTAALGRREAAEAREGTVYVDLSGEPSRAAEWGHALARLDDGSVLRSWKHVPPAASFGETGAAAGALAVCMAARGLSRGYAGRQAIVVLSDRDGCAALRMLAPEMR
jgi:3-oxoacyl-[acyl-carrier-protein] synthase I